MFTFVSEIKIQFNVYLEKIQIYKIITLPFYSEIVEKKKEIVIFIEVKLKVAKKKMRKKIDILI